MSQRSHHSPSPARSHVSNEPSRRSFAASPVREVTPITRQPTPAMDRADDTLYPLEISDAENLATELEKVELRRIKGPLDHAKLVYSEIKKWKFQLILGLFERNAAKVGLGNSWKEKRDEALALAQEYLGREPVVLPELVRGPMSRNEACSLREVWGIVSDCLSSPLALLRVSEGRHKVAALAIRPDKYAEIINCCSALLAKNMAALLKFNYPILVMPMFGKNGVSEDAFEVYKFSEFEILGLALRKEVEAFVLYLTRFQQRIEEHAAAKKAKKPRDSPPHFDSPRGGPRTSTPKKHQELDNSDIESADDEDEDLAHHTTRFVTPTQQASQSRMDPLRFSVFDPEVPRRGKRLTELFGKGGIPPPQLRNGQGPGGDPSDDSDSDSASNRGRPGRKIPPPPPGKQPTHPHKHNQSAAEPIDSHKEVSRFDLKLKMDVVPTWDGNTNSLTRWLMKVNSLVKRSTVIFSQLEIVAPQRFRRNAENWFHSLPEDTRDRIQSDWSTLKEAIHDHYMNRHWLDRQKAKANKARYRKGGYSKETPSEYYIRKLELLEFVYDYSDAELITEIMSGAPVIWNTILNPHQFVKVTDLQDTIKYYEETLAQLSNPKEREGRDSQFRPFRPRDKDARTNLAKAPTSTPKFPKDDSTVSKRKIPEEMGVRPCRHCGSGKHWDNECKYSRKAQRIARTNFVEQSPEERAAQEAYDELYLELDSEDEFELHQGSSEDQQDFRSPLQNTEASVHFAQPCEDVKEDTSDLKGEIDSNESLGQEVEAHASLARLPNRASRRRTAHQFRAHTHRVAADSSSKIYTMKKFLARPPGTSFLGARAIQARAHIGSLNEPQQDVIIDSGSDITLISTACWEKLSTPPKLKAGQRINLIQVTGSAKINGFVNIDLYFPTSDGYVQLEVEAYVVKGMSAPFILGNDFQNQYSEA